MVILKEAVSIMVILLVLFNVAYIPYKITGQQINNRENILTEIILDESFLRIKAGENIIGEIIIIQQNVDKPRDVRVKYYIKDLNNKIINSGEQTLALHYQSSITFKLNTPEDLKSDNNDVVAEIREVDEEKIISSSSNSFFIEGINFYEKIENDQLNLIRSE